MRRGSVWGANQAARRATRPARLLGRTNRLGYNGTVAKKVIALIVVGFAVFYLLTAPTAAADAVTGAFGAVIDAFVQVGVFVEALFR